MSLILDHINGVPDDHRLENLRILCPNCAATLQTHCGRKNRRPPVKCLECGSEFYRKRREQRFCSRRCSQHAHRKQSVAHRHVRRPPYGRLVQEIQATSYLAVGRKYGVSDNAVRKWVRFYENEMARERGARRTTMRAWPAPPS